MNTPFITWAIIVGILAVAVIIRGIASLVSSRKKHGHFRLIEIGSEREEFFVPGDSKNFDD